MLPESVDVVLAASDPLPSAVINKVQECVVGELHPSRPILLGPSAWQPKIDGRGAGLPRALLQDSQWVYSGALTSILTADLPVIVGHELQSIRWYYTRGGAGTITRAMYARNLATGAAETTPLGPTNDNAGAAWAGATDAALGIIRADHVAYSLEVTIGNAAHIFLGALVTYRKLP